MSSTGGHNDKFARSHADAARVAQLMHELLGDTDTPNPPDVETAAHEAFELAARLCFALDAARKEAERERLRARAELELLKQQMNNERLDILANTARVFLRLRANGCDKLEKRMEDAVASANQTAEYLNELVKMPVGAGAREIIDRVAKRAKPA
jgi:molecular chaperone GrpE (heat shock protein)